MHEYNTSRTDLILKEYGRNVQKIVDYLKTIEDREQRNRYAQTLVELMKQLSPGPKDAQDQYNKLWDDLFIMARFELDVDSPYPIPSKDILGRKPRRVEYSSHKLRYKHYGHNVELMIAKAIEMEDPEEKAAAVNYIARLMKTFYVTWNKEVVDDEVIIEHLRKLSDGKLSLDVDKAKEDRLFANQPRERRRIAPNNYSSDSSSSGGGQNYRSDRNDRSGGRNNNGGYRSNNGGNGGGNRPNNNGGHNRPRRSK